MPSSKKNISILLNKDVKNVGKTGEITTVAAGFARNFLVPNKLGVVATPALIASAKAKIEHEKAARAQEIQDAKNLADKLSGREIVLRVKAGQKGKLFGSINKKEIQDGLKNQHSATVTANQIDLAKPIRSLGKHTVTLKLTPEVSADITIQTVSAKN